MNLVSSLPCSSRSFLGLTQDQKLLQDQLDIDEEKLVITSSLTTLHGFVIQLDELLSRLDTFEKLHDLVMKHQNYDETDLVKKFAKVRYQFNLQFVRSIKLLERQLISTYQQQKYYHDMFIKIQELEDVNQLSL
ncbi:unnamed protein product [Ambrosiozyma monospora]|uniref:Unnamed protein product n=1 Tax=Ambrosiozyma monospora TaxID=43982 RepID=A0ACB5TQY7_AMBMO|nr:unnamed protein product [Ambrosiozyma monospora]